MHDDVMIGIKKEKNRDVILTMMWYSVFFG